MKILLLLCLFLSPQFLAQQTPLEKNNYQKLTSYDDLTDYVYQLDSLSDNLKVEIIGKSVEGRNLYALKFSNSEFGKDTSKIKLLLFAQQHGDEQSGKEGSLLLASKIIQPNLVGLLKYIDLVLVPQMNPDGSEKNIRYNANGMDLNRNHLILTEPEVTALHKLFDEYLFEATMDVHEYYPFSEDYMQYGYIKYFDEQIGTLTNPNVSERIRNFSNTEYLPFLNEYFKWRGLTFHNYIPGGPPEINYIRYSTYDINDGRQSLGIQNSFSFIQEGKNGRDSIDNIQRRAEGQFHGILAFLGFCSEHKDKIKSMVKEARDKLILGEVNDSVAIQMEHVSNGEKLVVQLRSIYSNTDSLITVTDFRPVVKSIYNVKRPIGYLIPKNLAVLYDWAVRQNLVISDFDFTQDLIIQEYFVSEIDSIDFEGDTVVNPVVELSDVKTKIEPDAYYFIQTNQIKNNLIVTALEPKSILGLVTYKQYAHLLKAGEYYPVLRVIKQNK
jgi:hypothetical protein